MSTIPSIKTASDKAASLLSSQSTQDQWHSYALIYAQGSMDSAQAIYSHLSGKQETKTIEKSLEAFQGLLNTLDTTSSEQLKKCSASSFSFVNSIPFNNTTPQLVAFNPPFILRKEANPLLHFKMLGNFPEGCKAKLHFTDEYIPSQQNHFQLDFKTHQNTIFPHAATGFTQKTGHLEIISKGVTHLFKVTVGMIPSSPGSMTINYSYTTQRSVTDTHDYTSDAIVVSSKKEYGNNDQINCLSTKYPTAGRKFKSDTVWIQILESDGEAAHGKHENDFDGPHISVKDSDHIEMRTTTRHHTKGTSGHRKFCVHAKETHTYDVTDTHQGSASVTLDWANTHTWSFPASLVGTPQVVFTPFQGSAQTYTSSTKVRYLQVEYGTGNITFKTPQPL